MTQQDVVERYEKRIRELQAEINNDGTAGALGLLILAIGMFLLFGLWAIRREVSSLLPLLPIPLIVVAGRKFLTGQKRQFRQIRLKRFYERAVARVNGDWTETPTKGEEFSDPDHVYANDLNCFGEGSLFQLLCTARTAIGRQRLADYLTTSPAVEETLLRQQAVRELQERLDLHDAVATLGEHEFLESRQQTFEEWLDEPPFDFPAWIPWVGLTTVLVLIGLVLAGVAGLIPWPVVARLAVAVLAIQAGIGVFFRERVNPMITAVKPLSAETLLLVEGLRLLEGQKFESPKLRALVGAVQGGAAAIAQLERPLKVLAQRDQEWFYLPSRLILAGTQACMAIERWRRARGAGLRAWLDAWAEFETLVALATYSRENPGNIFPEFSAAGICFEAQELGHPLLTAEGCVTNDVSLNRTMPFYVVSGSNMSGKSTLLRAIGLNSVLAFMGAPVRAKALQLSGLSVVASLSVGDSLLHGRSKFRAEVDRLRQAIEAAAGNRPVLFLVDEIFSGTNSRDRRVAAEAVVRTLVERGAIGALSTHDLALAEIAGADVGLGGINVHMGSRDGSDPMDFDYRLKLGITTEANALAIARMAGVPV